MTHTHDDSRWTFGCQACVDALEAASWACAPVRAVECEAWSIEADGQPVTWSFTRKMRVLDGAPLDHWRIMSTFGDCDELVMSAPATSDLLGLIAHSEITVVRVVDDKPTVSGPTLFEGVA